VINIGCDTTAGAPNHSAARRCSAITARGVLYDAG
jgi:hypothetical protein